MSGEDNSAVDAYDDEQEGYRQLQRVFNLAHEWQTAAAEVEVQPRSSLAGDDAVTDPFQVSHMVRLSIGVAVDHLHCLRAAVSEGRSLHTWGPFTLIRGAIESAATACYLLSPTTRDERVCRRLILLNEDDRLRDDFVRDMYPGAAPTDADARREERREDILQILSGRPGVDASRVTARPPGYATIVKTGATATALGGLSTLAIWRMCSAMAHGRQWGALSLLDMQELSRTAEGVTTVHMTANVTRVGLAANAAVALCLEAQGIFVQRATAP